MIVERRVAWTAAIVAVAGCFPSTTRPDFLPERGAPVTEVELEVPQATRAIALQLFADSIPVRRTEAKDGWLESDWFDARTLKPTSARPLGPGVVKVRAWIDPSRLAHSNVTVETVFRPLADPSRAPRQLEREVSDSHPVAIRVDSALRQLARQYGPKIDTVSISADSSTKTKFGPGGQRVKKVLRPDTTAVIPKKPVVKDTTGPVRQP